MGFFSGQAQTAEFSFLGSLREQETETGLESRLLNFKKIQFLSQTGWSVRARTADKTLKPREISQKHNEEYEGGRLAEINTSYSYEKCRLSGLESHQV